MSLFECNMISIVSVDIPFVSSCCLIQGMPRVPGFLTISDDAIPLGDSLRGLLSCRSRGSAIVIFNKTGYHSWPAQMGTISIAWSTDCLCIFSSTFPIRQKLWEKIWKEIGPFLYRALVADISKIILNVG